MDQRVADAVGNVMLETLRQKEAELDSQLEQLENLDEDDFEKIRERRRRELMKQAEKKRVWEALGHGTYTELADQKEFFEASKKSERLVCHFFRPSTPHCRIVDEHLAKLAKEHLETRFVRINAEKAPFLAERLNIWMIPTIQLVKNQQSVHQIAGFDRLGGTDKFSTQFLAWYISQFEVINYEGPVPESLTEETAESSSDRKCQTNIRRGIYDEDSDED